jgi:hypothetical protein
MSVELLPEAIQERRAVGEKQGCRRMAHWEESFSAHPK